MKKLLFLLCLSVATQAQQTLDLYLLIGQSNMAGRGSVDDYPLPSDSLWVLAKNLTWKIAKEPFHYDKTAAGAGLAASFAKSILRIDKRPIGFIPAAVGGTSIRYWQPGAKDPATGLYPYDDAVLRAKTALKDGTLKGILWHQGESDTERAQTYVQEFIALMETLHRDLGIPLGSVPVIAGETGEFGDKLASRQRLNAEIGLLPLRLPFVKVVSSQGLTHNGDFTHFDTPALRELGKRYADAFLSFRR
jgi:hypothetical protein